MTRPRVRATLLDQHARLDALFEELLEAAEAGADHTELVALWHRFDQELLAHLDAEERSLFPAMQARHLGEVQILKLEHARIRAALEELDVAVQLHVLREPQVKQFVALLRAHASREAAGVYSWAETELSEGQREELLGRRAA